MAKISTTRFPQATPEYEASQFDVLIRLLEQITQQLNFGFQEEFTQEPNIPTYYAEEQTYVPESHAWLLLGVPLCFKRRRR